jgi:uncharacterized protein involved in high-affinity Fe2+ transport
MSKTIYRGQVLTKDDLNIFIKDENGTFFNPFSITYTIYKVLSVQFKNQECGEEPVLETIDTMPIIFGIGKFFSAWNQAKDLGIGSYRIKWHIRRYSDSPIMEEIEDFDVVNKIDPMMYSYINGGTGILPHKAFGNQNLCAG